ncbi:DUF3152 domain-containing protein [Streptomyces sp. SCUT-3]|nr:DUF3152 domain-containing protein [Streptomyces sp. SCUT-3]QMV21863.1 DUF3152 domain-containing protein [Streptomyces sp. SCUT-3]
MAGAESSRGTAQCTGRGRAEQPTEGVAPPPGPQAPGTGRRRLIPRPAAPPQQASASAQAPGQAQVPAPAGAPRPAPARAQRSQAPVRDGGPAAEVPRQHPGHPGDGVVLPGPGAAAAPYGGPPQAAARRAPVGQAPAGRVAAGRVAAGPRGQGGPAGRPGPGPFVPPARGPRRDYVEAFDDPSPDLSGPADPQPPHSPHGTAGEDGAGGAGGAGGAHGEDGPGGGRPARAGSRRRTFTGVAAAAVTTALAIVVAGQVTGTGAAQGDSVAAGGPERSSGEPASRSDGRPTPKSPWAAGQEKPTYAQLMSRPDDLDPDLALSGGFETVPGSDGAPGEGPVKRYRVDVEKGLPLDGALFAEAVHRTLNDDRSWAHDGALAFERVSSGKVNFVITLASPGTTADWCARSGLDTTVDNVSCDSASTERIMINAYRWARGAETYGPDAMFSYRQMLINHEVGHRLGHGHEYCSEDGALAPVMMQQTKFLATDGATCRPNAWPHPES